MKKKEELLLSILSHVSLLSSYYVLEKKVFDILFIVTLSNSFSLQFVIDYFLWLVSLGSSSSSSSNCYLLT